MASVELLQETAGLLFFDKPAMLHSVQGKDNALGCAVEEIAARFPELRSLRPSTPDRFLCNRLDFSTSGILIAAKTAADWENIREQYSQKVIEKTYLCAVQGSLEQSMILKDFLGNRYRGSKKVTVFKNTDGNRGQWALSQIAPVTRLEKFSLVRLTTSTGTRHQVRVQLSNRGHPLVGDTLYDAVSTLSELDRELANWHTERAPRDFFLHAERVSLREPRTGEKVIVISISPSLPEDRSKLKA